MFFIISKVLAFVLSPFLWIMGLLLWALFTKKQNRRKFLLVAMFCLTYLLSNRFLCEEVYRKWEYPATNPDSISQAYDLGIVLGGFASFDTTRQMIRFHESSDRLWHAIYLYKTGKVKKLLITGGSGKLLHQKETEADRVYNFLLKIGIPEKDMLIDAKSRNTRENAVETLKLVNKSNPNARCLLITSAFHMRRSIGCFKKVHLDITPFSTDFKAGKRIWDPDNLLLPQPNAIGDWGVLIREYVGYLTYKVAGYI